MAKSVTLSPEAIKKCMDACDDLIMGLRKQLDAARMLGVAVNFGDIPSANQLRAGFEKLATGDSGSLVERLQSFIDVAEQIKANFEANGEGFTEMEQEFASRLKQTGNVL